MWWPEHSQVRHLIHFTVLLLVGSNSYFNIKVGQIFPVKVIQNIQLYTLVLQEMP